MFIYVLCYVAFVCYVCVCGLIVCYVCVYDFVKFLFVFCVVLDPPKSALATVRPNLPPQLILKGVLFQLIMCLCGFAIFFISYFETYRLQKIRTLLILSKPFQLNFVV